MHEIAVAGRVLEIALEAAREHGGGRVAGARLMLGELTCVDADTLAFAFGVASRGTAADGCRLDIARIAARLRCRACRIAGELNRQGVPSPGAQWQRQSRHRDGKWLASTICGNPKSVNGILNNEIYAGRFVWNRPRSKKKFKSGKREFHLRPRAKWVQVERPELRIVPPDLWERVRMRQRERSAAVGLKIREGLTCAAADGHVGADARAKVPAFGPAEVRRLRQQLCGKWYRSAVRLRLAHQRR